MAWAAQGDASFVAAYNDDSYKCPNQDCTVNTGADQFYIKVSVKFLTSFANLLRGNRQFLICLYEILKGFMVFYSVWFKVNSKSPEQR